jgi:uncharacterized protein YeeX (DUF496 family)
MTTLKDFDLTGFVNFPHHTARSVKTVDCGATSIYLIAFSESVNQMSQELKLVGNFAGDDVMPRSYPRLTTSIEDNIKNLTSIYNSQKDFYFSNQERFGIISQVLIGWSKYSYEYTDRIDPWICTFRELSNEGRKLYYSLKKLHNDAEIRLLTFNNIQ